MFTCGWCGVHYPKWQDHCSHCGGDLPPEGKGLGPPPKPPPRKLPRGFSTRQWWTANFGVVFGTIFLIAGAAITSLFILAGTWFALVPGFFAFFGLVALMRGIGQARGVLRAFRFGECVEGVFTSIERDPLYAGQKGGAPWIVKYTFTVGIRAMEGSFSTFEEHVRSLLAVGRPVWVLYVKGDPAQNTIYPPLK